MARGGCRLSFGGAGRARYDDIGKENDVDVVVKRIDNQEKEARKDETGFKKEDLKNQNRGGG